MEYKIIIQARTGSSRLPGKVLIELVPGKTVLECLIDRLSFYVPKSNLIIATTTEVSDKKILALADKLKIKAYAGSEQNVLERYYQAAKQYDAKNIVRITSDCPLMDGELLRNMLQEFEHSQCDYLANVIDRTYPRGLDIEIFQFTVLQEAYNKADEPAQLEHVTPYIHQHPEIFELKDYINKRDLSDYRWTLDTKEDLALIKAIYQNLYVENNNFTTNDILQLLDLKPELIKLNAHIEQKKI
jgi:spore coat polysaccharide biosynthesis protein SpsF